MALQSQSLHDRGRGVQWIVSALIGSGIRINFCLLSSTRVRTSGDGSSPVTQ